MTTALPDGLYNIEGTSPVYLVRNGFRSQWGGQAEEMRRTFVAPDAEHYVQRVPADPFRAILAAYPAGPDWREIQPFRLPSPLDPANWEKVVTGRRPIHGAPELGVQDGEEFFLTPAWGNRIFQEFRAGAQVPVGQVAAQLAASASSAASSSTSSAAGLVAKARASLARIPRPVLVGVVVLVLLYLKRRG